MAPGEVVEFLARLPGPVRAVYEAGPTGFGLARVAPSAGSMSGSWPRARSRARRGIGSRPIGATPSAWRGLLAAGELRFAFVPSGRR